MIEPWDTQTITEVQPLWVDVRGVLTADWSSPVFIEHDGFTIRPGKGGRDFAFGTGVKLVRRLYGPPDTVIDPYSRIELPRDSGRFVILEGPETFESAEMIFGLGDGPGHIALTVAKQVG